MSSQMVCVWNCQLKNVQKTTKHGDAASAKSFPASAAVTQNAKDPGQETLRLGKVAPRKIFGSPILLSSKLWPLWCTINVPRITNEHNQFCQASVERATPLRSATTDSRQLLFITIKIHRQRFGRAAFLLRVTAHAERAGKRC